MRQGCAEAGGECKAGEAWSRTCTWRILPTADVTLPPIIMEVENLEGVIFHFHDYGRKGIQIVWISKFVRQPHHQAKKALFGDPFDVVD